MNRVWFGLKKSSAVKSTFCRGEKYKKYFAIFATLQTILNPYPAEFMVKNCCFASVRRVKRVDSEPQLLLTHHRPLKSNHYPEPFVG
jgi:hypothetical protein